MKKHAHLDTSLSKTCANCGSAFFRDKRCTHAHWERARFCSRKCSAVFGAIKHYEKFEKLEDRVKKRSEAKSSGCRIWTGPTNGRYGVLSVNGKLTYVHRAILKEKLKRDIKSGYLACHTCDNPLCTNPNHIYEGTHASNSQDMCVRQRIWWQKLTPEQVKEIRASSLTYARLSEKYNVSETAIAKIVKRKTWKHV